MDDSRDVENSVAYVWVAGASGENHSAEKAEFTIGELSREFGVTLRALRFYEAKGFISPRRVRNMRLYSQQDRARIAAILTGKKLGFTLADIRTMVAGPEGARDAEGLKVTK